MHQRRVISCVTWVNRPSSSEAWETWLKRVSLSHVRHHVCNWQTADRMTAHQISIPHLSTVTFISDAACFMDGKHGQEVQGGWFTRFFRGSAWDDAFCYQSKIDGSMERGSHVDYLQIRLMTVCDISSRIVEIERLASNLEIRNIKDMLNFISIDYVSHWSLTWKYIWTGKALGEFTSAKQLVSSYIVKW